MIFACLGATGTGLVLGLWPLPSGWPRLGVAAVFGAFAFQLYALAVAHANDHAPPGGFIETSGGLLLTFGIGAVAGPLAASALMTRHGPATLFLFISAVHLALAGFIAYRMSRRNAALTESPERSRADGRSAPGRWRLRWAVR